MRIVIGFLGRILMLLGVMLLVPLIFALLSGETECASPFILTAAASAAVGAILHFRQGKGSPSTAQAMTICSLSWLVLSIAGAVPFVLIIDASWVDAVFETMSGFTTTGITMFTGLDDMPKSLLLWRSITQWVGGLGILTFFMAVSSQVPGAHRLMGAESHKIFAGRPVPGLLHTVKILWTIYGSFTALVAGGYLLAGMNSFDAVNHALTTLSTGGFSPHDASIGWFSQTGTGHPVLIEYIATAGMLAGGISFLAHYRVFRGEGIRALWKGGEMKLWWTLILLFMAVIMGEQLLTGRLSPGELEQGFRKDLFQTASVLTTTGFSTESLTSSFFGAAARQLFLVMMVIGGCVGSTSGGIKVLRVSILISMAREEIDKLFRADRSVSGIRYQGVLVGRDELSRIAGIVFMWFCLLIAGGAVTALLTPEMDGYTAFSGMFSALGNIGPCFIGLEQMTSLHWGVKITYIIGMLAGRLEILPVMLLFSRKAWR